MSLTYTWSLTSLKKRNTDNLSDIVVQTYWKKIGTDQDGITGEFSGATPFDPQQVDPNNFTSFENLTEQQVLGWIQSVVTGPYEVHVNQKIQEQINLKKQPISEVNPLDFPWGPPPENVPSANT